MLLLLLSANVLRLLINDINELLLLLGYLDVLIVGLVLVLGVGLVMLFISV
jgi:hypothetical protein